MMKLHKTLFTFFCLSLTILNPLYAQQNSPAFMYTDALNTYFSDSSGHITFTDNWLAFAPEGKFKGQVTVVDANSTVIGSYNYFDEYTVRNGVFARARAQNSADITLAKPGIYSIVYLVDGQPVTRLPFKLEQASAGNDPFNPQRTYRFDGYWRTFAYITMDRYMDDEAFPEVRFWVGGVDLPEGKKRDAWMLVLFRDGKLVAHSKRSAGVIMEGHFKEQRSTLYMPHDAGKEYKTKNFLEKDWLVDGIYELRVVRMSDKISLRSYDFKVVGGKIKHHPRSTLGYQPQVDYIVPRTLSGSEIIEIFWIEDRKIQ